MFQKGKKVAGLVYVTVMYAEQAAMFLPVNLELIWQQYEDRLWIFLMPLLVLACFVYIDNIGEVCTQMQSMLQTLSSSQFDRLNMEDFGSF